MHQEAEALGVRVTTHIHNDHFHTCLHMKCEITESPVSTVEQPPALPMQEAEKQVGELGWVLMEDTPMQARALLGQIKKAGATCVTLIQDERLVVNFAANIEFMTLYNYIQFGMRTVLIMDEHVKTHNAQGSSSYIEL